MPDSVKLSLISSFAAMSDSRNYFCSKSSPFLISRHFAHADLILHYRTISSGSLSGTLSASYARLSKIEVFTITFTKISGTLPTEFAGLGIFTISNSLVSGSLPDMTSWGNVSALSFASNKLSGSFLASQLPPKSSYFDISLNWLSADRLQLSALPATMSLVDLSYNSYQGLLLTASDLTVQPPQSNVLVMNMKGNQIFCPLPGKSELPSNFDLLTDRCVTDYFGLFPYGTVLASVLVAALVVFLLGKCCFKQIFKRVLSWRLLPQFLLAKHCVVYAISAVSLVNIVQSFYSMFSALAFVSPDNCSLVNLKQLWMYKVPFTFLWLDGTRFPPPDLYSNFSQYAQLSLSGFPGQLYPHEVQMNIEFFQTLCLDWVSGECAYESDNYRCIRVADFAQDARNSFAKFVWASVALVAAKEIIKLLAVLYTLCVPNRVPGALEVKSLWSPLLAMSLRRRCFSLVVLASPPFWENLRCFLFEGSLNNCALQ